MDDEKKFQLIITKTNEDYSRYTDYIKSNIKEEYFKNRNITIFSVFFSGFFSFKFLNKKIILRENNGHFNSPQTLLNKKLSYIL